MKIYKFELPMDGVCIELPKGAKVLTAHEQHTTIMLWIMGDFPIQDGKVEKRFFEVFATGEPDLRQGKYIQTVFMNQFVWHIFEVFYT